MWLWIIFLIILILLILVYPKLQHLRNQCDHLHLKTSSIFSIEPSIFHLEEQFNPSIVKTKDGNYTMVVRKSSRCKYNLLQGLYGRINETSQILIYRLNSNFDVIKISQLELPTLSNFKLEDPRITCGPGGYYLIITAQQAMKNIPILVHMDYEFKVKQVIRLFDTSLPLRSREKNWVPFFRGKKLYIHTDVSPKWVIRQVNIKTGELMPIVNQYISHQFGDLQLSCSTSPIIIDGTMLLAIHAKKPQKFIARYYTIFVKVNPRSFLPEQFSPLLCFDPLDHQNIQFISGLCRLSDQKIVLGFGFGDYTANLKIIDEHELNKVFIPDENKPKKRQQVKLSQ